LKQTYIQLYPKRLAVDCPKFFLNPGHKSKKILKALHFPSLKGTKS